jgi:aromatic-L-amino-acid decarboxylase
VPRDASSRSPNPIELDGDQLRTLMTAVLDRVGAHVDSLPSQPAHDLDGCDALARSLAAPLPEHGRPLPEVLDLLFDRAVPKSFNTAGPGYLAYIPGGGIPTAALADFIACAVNRFVNVTEAAPALARIEQVTLRWLAGEMGMPAGAGGIFSSGGSLSNLSAIVAAREARLGGDFARGVIYFSEQTHACVAKGARIAGFAPSSLRALPVDRRLRLEPEALARAVAADRAAGRVPFLVVANAGTTNTGAIDPLPAVLEIARREGLWVHADAAYGGFFRLVEDGGRLLPGLGDCDSITLDPHKGLFLPYGTGTLLMRDPGALHAAFRSQASYLRDLAPDGEGLGFTDLSPELSRDFRGLRLWLPLQVHGLAAFRVQLAEKLALARRAWERLRAEPLFEMLDEPQLSIVAFTARPPRGDANAFGAEVLRRVNARRRVFLSGAVLDGRYVLRICVLSFRSHAEQVDLAVEALIEEARALAGGG